MNEREKKKKKKRPIRRRLGSQTSCQSYLHIASLSRPINATNKEEEEEEKLKKEKRIEEENG